jgi:hypothetical protein
MGSMPNWFAKTKEMVAFDRYFSMVDVDEQELRDRYLRALDRLQGAKYFTRSDALDTEWAGRPNVGTELKMSLDGHFRGDWVHHLYPTDPGTYGAIGGRFWPQVPSDDVLDRLRAGTVFAIHKALGDSELVSLGLPPDYRDRLWKAERENSIPIDDGIRPVAMSWNCVAPAGENFFEVDALRGPSVVEFAIATPRPFGHASVMSMADDLRAGLIAFGEPGSPES